MWVTNVIISFPLFYVKCSNSSNSFQHAYTCHVLVFEYSACKLRVPLKFHYNYSLMHKSLQRGQGNMWIQVEAACGSFWDSAARFNSSLTNRTWWVIDREPWKGTSSQTWKRPWMEPILSLMTTSYWLLGRRTSLKLRLNPSILGRRRSC